jgi:prephenate dehydrogenase
MKRRLKDTEIVVSSGDRKAMRTVSDIGAADQTIGNLRNAVEGAQLIILDAPIGDMRELMEAIGPILEHGAVVTDTSPTKTPMIKWADSYLRDGVDYVGGHPLPKRTPTSIESADASIFTDARYTVTPGKSADEASIRTVVGLIEALGSKPLFLDPDEHDSYAAAMHYLPLVMSSAFVNATAGSEGWREMHELADANFDTFSRLASNDPLDNEAVCLASPDALVHWIDELIGQLYGLRNQIKDKDERLLEQFVNSWELRARWEADAVVPDDRAKLPSAADSMASAFFGEKLAQRMQSFKGGDEKKKSFKYFRKNE